MFVRALTKTGKWLLYMLAGLLILVALLAASARLAVFYGDDYSERLASVVSRFLGSPVQISDIKLVWNRFDASASLTDVRILSEDSAETLLVLPSIELELNLRDMLLQRNLSIRKVQLRNLSLVAAYEGHDELRILGYEISRSTSGSNTPLAGAANNQDLQEANSATPESDDQARRGYSALSWLFNAERIAILDSDITLTDSTRNKTHRIDHVDIRAFNSGDLHQIRIDSALPGAMGETSVASFDFTGKADNVDEWTGQFYVDAKRLNLGEISDVWRDQLHKYSGQADLQLWGRWRGTRVNEVRAIVNARDFAMDLNATNPDSRASLQLDRLDVDLDWRRTSEGWESTFNTLSLSFDDQQVEPLQLAGVDLYAHRYASGQREFRMAGPEIVLDELSPLFKFSEQVSPSLAMVRQIQGGTIRDWLIAAELNDSKWSMRAARAQIEQLVIEPSPAATDKRNSVGVNGLSADVYFNNGTGKLDLLPQSIEVSIPRLFSAPLPELVTQGSIGFAQVDDEWIIATEGLKVGSVDVATDTEFQLRMTPDDQQIIDLNMSIEHINLAKVKQYFPTEILKPKLLKWLNEAIVDGNVVRGQLTLAGDLKDFSPANDKGVFFGEVDVVDSTLKFKPDWPAATAMDGNITFDSQTVRGRVYQGAIREMKFSDARVFLPDFKNPVIELQTNVIGPLSDVLDFAQSGPLANKIGGFFGDATGSGASRLSLDLKVPLKRELRDRLKINGTVLLQNAQINASRFGLDLESVTGQLGFNRRGVAFDSLRVRYLGLPLKVRAVQKSSGSKHINTITVNGPVAVASVLQSYGVPLTKSFEGISDWRVKLDISRNTPTAKPKIELTATSDLSGTAISLPVPLDKQSDTLVDAQVYRDFSAKDSDWWVGIAGLVQARVKVGSDRKLESMAVALGNSTNTVLPWRGLAVQGDVTRLDALGWLNFALDLGKSLPTGSNKEPFPLFGKVNARSLLAGSQDLGSGVYIAYRDGSNQIHRIENRHAGGELAMRMGGGVDEPLVVRLNHLDKALFEKLQLAQTADSSITNRPFDPRKIRPLDVIVKELKWDNWRVSRVALRTQPEERGLAIVGLTARQDSMRVSGSGRWEVYDVGGGRPEHATTLDLNGTFDDVGQGIKALGGGSSFADGQGEVAVSLGWPAAAYTPDLQRMTGDLFFSLRNGRILGVEPGAGRILGLFALQALPRRLTLDFRDMVRLGLEYTSINGNFVIADGKATTQTLLLTGPVAEILVTGDSDFVNQTYDQTIDVLPRVSGALPLIGVLTSGPAAGVTALVADGILKGLGVNLDEIGRRRFTLRGNWDTPSWETVDLTAVAR